MRKNNISVKGFSMTIAMIIGAVLVVGGIAAYFLLKKSPEQKVTETEKAIEDIAVAIPVLDFSSSPDALPDLNVSALNVGTFPAMQTNKLFAAPTINTDFSYKPDLKIDMPATPQVNFEMPMIPTTIPTSIPSTPTPQATPSGSSQSAGTGAPAVDCSMFAAPPSCSYVGAPGSQGYEACKQCYPNK